MMYIELRGHERVMHLLQRLPQELKKEILSKSNEFCRFVQKSAKLRAPRFTGQLAESIRVFREENAIKLIVGSPYGIFQEMGFTPRFLPADLPVEGGYRIGDWMQAKGISGFGIMPRGIPHPFIMPAFKSGLRNLPNILKNAVTNAINKSRK